jgi:hypothetical protein
MSNILPILGIHGKKRHGKDTIAAFIAHFSVNKAKYAFADPVKEATSKMFGLPLEKMYHGDREAIDPFWEMSPRTMMQLVGTDCARNVIREDIWIKRAEYEYMKEKKRVETIRENCGDLYSNQLAFCISDVRFENEATWVRDNGVLLHVIRPQLLTPDNIDTHESEKGILEKENDVIFINDGTVEDLLNLVREYLIGEHDWVITDAAFKDYINNLKE